MVNGEFNNIKKITDKIIGEAQEYENSMLDKAQKEADAISRNYESQAEEIGNSILEKGRKNAEAILARAESGSALIKRNAVLQMKADLVGEVFKNAENRIISMPENEFSDFLMRMLVKANKSESTAGTDGEVIFNARDREKFGRKFAAEANRQIKDRKFVLSKNTANIKSGFILKFGSIEINCSIEKIVESKKAYAEPKIIKILFDDKQKAR